MIEIKNNRYVRVRSLSRSSVGTPWDIATMVYNDFHLPNGSIARIKETNVGDYPQDALVNLGTEITKNQMMAAIASAKEFFTGSNPKLTLTYANGFSFDVEENTKFPTADAFSTALLVTMDMDLQLAQNQ